jgi:hypothetical protein
VDAQKIIRDQFLDLATNFASQLLGHPVPSRRAMTHRADR